MNKKVHGRENDSVKVEESAPTSEVALREEAVLSYWREQDIFNKSIKHPAGIGLEGDKVNGEAGEGGLGHFVFYDGPPFATGLPHYGHILAGTIKDAIPRFWTMNGYRVRRQWGWDCHGLPLENIVEKELGLATKRDIEEYGIKNFNEKARGMVLRYADDWREIIPRFGRFVDMQNDYKTMDSSYTESVWWAFKQLHEKGLVYEGFKTMHLCPRCGTTLSNFEVNQGYKDIKDIAVTVKLPLLDEAGEVSDTSLLVWTTTPWTLPGNTVAAVHNEIDYVTVKIVVEGQAEKVIVAKSRLSQLGNVEYEIIDEYKGAALVGKKYKPPFPWLTEEDFSGKENAWTIYHADYVEEGEEGTGAVHIAPAYGEDDMNLAKENDVPIVHHVDESGHFKPFVTDFAGQLVKPRDDDASEVTHLDADIEVVKALKERGVLFKKENITHSYPHCWRCETPLLNYATTSWFVEVTKIRDQLVSINQTVNWVPEHVGKNRFGKWLEGARDWAVSRQRYWGAPLPIWKNPETGEYKVLGSLSELQEYVPNRQNKYFFMRHGESESNASNVVQTIIDNPNALTETGKEQVKQAVKQLREAGITRIITSPFERTVETAKLLQEELELPNEAVQLDERLREIAIPELEGESNTKYRELVQTGKDWSQAKTANGESWSDVRNRVGDFLYDINTQYENETLLIVGHNAPLRMVSAITNGDKLTEKDFDHDDEGARYENAEVRQIDFTPLPHNEQYELDFHRPYIDEFELYEDGVLLERVPDVFDCWFESGSMPYAQHHYPFAMDEANFTNEHFPAQFIAEGLDQTRGWFYSMMVLGVALFEKSPYENVIVNGLVLAEDGKKMSKSLQNYPDPIELANRVGADSIRFYLLSSPIIKGEDLNFSEKDVTELQRKNIGRLHNVLAMYEMYQDGTKANGDSRNVLDRWIITRLNQLISEVTDGYKNYELDKATRPITDFIDDLSVWYLRRSRDRLKHDDLDDKQATLATLRYVLQNLAKCMAPAMPFYAEHLYQAVKGVTDVESVHLTRWPQPDTIDTELLAQMETTREIVTTALEKRTKAGIKVRQPIKSVSGPQLPEELQTVITDELNAKSYQAANEVAIDQNLTPELLAEGAVRELMRAIQSKRKNNSLEPNDTIALTIETSESGQNAINEHQALLTKTVGADAIEFTSTEGETIVANDYEFTFSFNKL